VAWGCGDVELVGYLANAAGPVPLVLDLRIALTDLEVALTKAYYQAFFWVLIDLIVELLDLISNPLIIRQRTEIQYQMI
jgi:hypothetical protein